MPILAHRSLDLHGLHSVAGALPGLFGASDSSESSFHGSDPSLRTVATLASLAISPANFTDTPAVSRLGPPCLRISTHLLEVQGEIPRDSHASAAFTTAHLVLAQPMTKCSIVSGTAI